MNDAGSAGGSPQRAGTLLLRGGSVIDGAGNPATRADIALAGDRIAAVGSLEGYRAERTIDVTGLVVCPGFVDMHAHSDLQLLVEKDHLAKVSQGVTTEVLGQDGLSYAPVDPAVLGQLRARLRGWNDDPGDFDWSWRTVGEYLDRLDEGIAVNAAYLLPHGTIRMLVVGLEDRPATAEELDRMRDLVAQGLVEGAVGLSAGLTYTPGMYADDDELVALCRVVAEHGGYYAPHHRDYGRHALRAYADCIEIARRSGVALHLTHAHLGFPVNRGRAGELLAMVDEAAAEGLEVTLDSYPYLAGATYLHALLPGWAQEGRTDDVVRRLAAPEIRERIAVEVEKTGHSAYHHVPTDWRTVVVTGVTASENRRLVGRSIAEVAAAEGIRPIDLYCDALILDRLGASCVHHIGNEENVRAIMRHPAHMAGSDGILVGERPHPRAWGTFPRYLAHYVREERELSLPDAIRKFTSLPAQRLGFSDRGLLRPGMVADLIALDPETVQDLATYAEPRRQASGILHVIVNGVPVLLHGAPTGARPGRALRRGGSALS
jgi:N-acyl-D-amino-acid deacylase